MAHITTTWNKVTDGTYPLRLIDNGDGSYSLDTTGSGGGVSAFAKENFTADGSGDYTLADTPDAGTVMLYVGGGNDIGFTMLANVLTETVPSVAGVKITITYFH